MPRVSDRLCEDVGDVRPRGHLDEARDAVRDHLAEKQVEEARWQVKISIKCPIK